MMPRAISADGSVIAGGAYAPAGAVQAFKWTLEGGSVGLGWLPGGGLDSEATSMSADGSRIFGYSVTHSPVIESVYWDAAGELHRLYTPDNTMQIYAVDATGSTAIGIGFPLSYVWQEDAGWHELTDLLLSDFNIDLTTESPIEAWGVSDDGRTLVGWGTVSSGREGWVVHLPTRIRVAPACYPNCDRSTQPPVLNVSDFVCFLSSFAAGLPYANCDGSTTPPVLNVADFTCFLQKLAAGCP
jgi:hypothetical protein